MLSFQQLVEGGGGIHAFFFFFGSLSRQYRLGLKNGKLHWVLDFHTNVDDLDLMLRSLEY